MDQKPITNAKDYSTQRAYVLTALGQIVGKASVDRGQYKAPSKQDYKDACLAVRREAQDAIDYLIS